MDRLYVRYYCSEEDCDYGISIEGGMPRSEDGVFKLAAFGCPIHDVPMRIEVNDDPFPKQE